MQKVSKLMAYIFHPVLMPILGLFIIFNVGIYEVEVPWQIQRYTYLIFVLFSVLLPLSILPLFVYFKLIGSVELSERKERALPIAIGATCLILLHIFLSNIIPIRIITSYTFALAALSIVLLFINVFHKTSMHLMGIGGIIGLILAISVEYHLYPFYLMVLAVLLAGTIGTSRMVLRAHSLAQTASGFLLGAVGTYLIITLQV